MVPEKSEQESQSDLRNEKKEKKKKMPAEAIITLALGGRTLRHFPEMTFGLCSRQ